MQTEDRLDDQEIELLLDSLDNFRNMISSIELPDLSVLGECTDCDCTPEEKESHKRRAEGLRQALEQGRDKQVKMKENIILLQAKLICMKDRLKAEDLFKGFDDESY